MYNNNNVKPLNCFLMHFSRYIPGLSSNTPFFSPSIPFSHYCCYISCSTYFIFFCAVAFVSLSLSTCIFSVNFARFCLLLFGARKKCLRDFVWWAAVACLIYFLVPIQPFILFQINRVCLLLFFSSIIRKDKLNFIKLLTLRHKNERDACTEIAQHFFIRHKSIQISRKHVNWNSSTYANLTWFGYSMLWLIHEKIASNWIKCNIFAKSVQFTSPPSKKPFRSIRQLKKIKCKN